MGVEVEVGWRSDGEGRGKGRKEEAEKDSGSEVGQGVQNIPRGKRILKILKMTSVIASWARACTLEFLIRRHQSQQANLITTVRSMMIMAGKVSSTTE